jgi:hypothetical protein
MSSLVGRFRAWLQSVEFVVTTVGIVVALAAGAVAFETSQASVDGYFVILLAGVAVPGIYENYWPEEYDRRVLGVAWALGACLGLLTVYALVSILLGTVLDGFAPRAGAFATAWLVGIFTANAYGADSA